MKYYYLFILLFGFLMGKEAPDYGLYFNGENSYVEIPDHESLNLTENFTIEFWVKPDSFLLYGHILNKHQPGINDDGSWVMKYIKSETSNHGTVSFSWPYTPNSTSGATIKNNIGEWFHFAICYDKEKSNLTFWINGEKKLNQRKIIQINDTDWSLYLGSEITYNHFQGLLSEIRISSIVRYKDEFRPQLSYLVDDFTLAYWACNDGLGNVLIDKGSFGNDGKMVNVEWLNTKEAKSPFSLLLVGATVLLVLTFFFVHKNKKEKEVENIAEIKTAPPVFENGKGVTILLGDPPSVIVDGQPRDIKGGERYKQVFNLLTLLGNAPEFKLSHQDIKTEIWPLVIEESFVNSLNVTLTALRKQLDPYQTDIIHQGKMVGFGKNINVLKPGP